MCSQPIEGYESLHTRIFFGASQSAHLNVPFLNACVLILPLKPLAVTNAFILHFLHFHSTRKGTIVSANFAHTTPASVWRVGEIFEIRSQLYNTVSTTNFAIVVVFLILLLTFLVEYVAVWQHFINACAIAIGNTLEHRLSAVSSLIADRLSDCCVYSNAHLN